DGALRKNLLVRLLPLQRWSTFPSRDAAHRLFRNGRTKDKISVKARNRRMAGLLLSLRTPGRLRRAEFPYPRRALSRRAPLDPEWPVNVDHQRGVRECIHAVRQG